MSGRRVRTEKKEYGDPDVRLRSLLNNLRLVYKKGVDQATRATVFYVGEFGVQIHLTKNHSDSRVLADGSVAMFFCQESSEEEITAFGEELMWHLIASGYMAYIREERVGNKERIFQALIIEQGWGRRIMDRRLELWKKDASKTYMYDRLKEFKDSYTVIELVARYPGFFDFLA